MHFDPCFSTLARHTLVCLFLGIGARAHAVVDLTPTPAEYTAEGIKFKQLLFKDDKQTISYDLPRGWNYRFEGGCILLTPSQTPFAEAVMQAVPIAKPQPFDEAASTALERQVLGGLPPNSQEVRVLKKEQNLVLLNGNVSLEIVVTYELLGTTFQRSVLFVNVTGTQLVFRLSARKNDFEALHNIFRTSLLSLQWIEPTAGAS